MLLKQLKHDMVFGKTMFFALGLGIVAAAIGGLIAFNIMEDEHVARQVINYSAFMVMGLTFGFVAVHISQFIEKSMYSDAGYLTFTLPVTRGQLLVSKLLSAFAWLHFILVAVFIGLVILQGTHTIEYEAGILLPRVGVGLFAMYINVSIMYFFGISVMLFGLTLHNSVFGRWKIPGFFTAVLCLGTVIAYSVSAIRLLNRSRESAMIYAVRMVGGEAVIYQRSTWQQTISLDVGRLAVGNSYIDLYIGAVGVGVGALAFIGTLYLLNKRVSLQ